MRAYSIHLRKFAEAYENQISIGQSLLDLLNFFKSDRGGAICLFEFPDYDQR